jgi:hypothetical protein
MTTDTKTDEKKSAKTTAERSAAGVSSQALLTTPVIIKLGKSNKKKKKKYSRGTKGLQRLIVGVSKATSRSANSLAKGTKTFAKRSNKSARKKRDGSIRDSLRNASRGISDGFTELGKAPNEIARRIGTGQVRRAFRVFIPFGN